MSTALSALSAPDDRPRVSANAALQAAAALWFTIAVVGQVIFATSTALFYGLTALRGDLHAWNKHLRVGYVDHDPLGNAALMAHLICAVVIILCGALQFSQTIRTRLPQLHRWNGRLYIATAFSVSLAGMGLLLFRPTPTSFVQNLGTFTLGVIIMLCAAMALRYALKRDFVTHRRWALRLFLVVSAALFIRAGATLFAMIAVGTGRFDVSVIQGPVLTILSYGQFVVPLAVLELYFWTQRHGGTAARIAMAAGLLVLTLITGGGVASASVALFLPNLRAAFDPRHSIAETLALTLKTSGIDAAIAQYHLLQTTQPRTYNFDEDELNALGYTLLRARQYPQAIAILQINTQTYPKSANTWDSLGEAYMDDGDTQPAIADYEKSLAMNPANRNAAIKLAKLHGS